MEQKPTSGIYATPKRAVERYFFSTPCEGMYVLLRNKRYNKERDDSKTLLRPVLKLPKYETLY